ncbi:LacI family DNA-binding transcriptional regulator [Microbacterium thalassium]|uniref:DNA-binding LacI/PurR family transcriptional regulator n=1 Tax=Microbacterium thalassium TaxID=362649 RepID=A0A7X0FP80_9MICO|nr:LacI family DNA-binding transcriptional regulator [Microbacterium thalassium]MBB6390577.1 DNA-binding LacI/PurR family transcriptional regulator [Microbacterium thalassium]GLK25688.1 LacI family transcriptional regulator [Microbacterium thalassium]
MIDGAPPAGKRPTIKDVAKAAGVSPGTVSRVLNGRNWVSPESKAAVEDAIARVGFRPNAHARTLATGRTNSIAFLLTEPQQMLFEDPNFARLLRGATAAAAERDTSVVLMVADTSDERRRAREFLGDRHVDGVLLISTDPDDPLIDEIGLAHIPTVICGPEVSRHENVGYVGADDRGGARMATAHLVGLGRHRIACIAGPERVAEPRVAGYRDAVGDAFDGSLVAYGDWTPESGRLAMERLLAAHPDIDGVFAQSDGMAAGALDALAAAGRRVPEDVAVTGFDDQPIAARLDPPLTTMHQPFEKISAEMVGLLLEMVEGAAARTIALPTELVERESA